MNFQLTQEQEMLVEAVRSFVAKELLPHEEAVDRADARVDAAMERASTELTEARDGFTGWLDTWKGKPRDPK